ncbi:hypothetical protein [Megamonas hypermegale]|uniref:hypothetical protein n=1 Tax=Megamonas hypermegale TaxID=158847 RepID=UPI00255CD4C7|nr:hypothetical protein [Megamonas hypermegale]
MKNIIFMETIVFLICGIILSLASGSPIMLAISIRADIALAIIQFVGIKIAFTNEEIMDLNDTDDYTSCHSAQNL